MITKKDPTQKLLRKQERETRRKQRKFERQSKQALRDRMRRRYAMGGRIIDGEENLDISDGRMYNNGGRPGGFLSSTARGGFPKEKAFKSYYPTTSSYDVTRGDTREQGFSQGYTSGLKEVLQLYKTAGGGGERKIIGLPTGRRYVDIDQHAVRNTYKDNEPIKSRKFTYKEKRDDIEKTYDKYKGYTKMTPEGGKSKTTETGGVDLNWFQRNFPGLFTERYKVKSKYGPEGELLRRVTTSRAGGREVKEYPTQAALDAMIALDILAAQSRNGE